MFAEGVADAGQDFTITTVSAVRMAADLTAEIEHEHFIDSLPAKLTAFIDATYAELARTQQSIGETAQADIVAAWAETARTIDQLVAARPAAERAAELDDAPVIAAAELEKTKAVLAAEQQLDQIQSASKEQFAGRGPDADSWLAWGHKMLSDGGAWVSGKLDSIQLGLDVGGLIPGIGIVFDALNTIISLGRGNWGEAGLNAMAMVPGFGQGVAGAKLTAKAAGVVPVVFKFGDEAAALGKNTAKGITTPTTKLQKWAQQGGYIDPRTNKWIKFDGTLAADHVYPKSLIKKLPGFDKLTREQKDFLLNYPGNFEPLPKAWNSSKLNRLADDWAKTPMGRQASKEFIDGLRERQQAFEGFAKNLIAFFTN